LEANSPFKVHNGRNFCLAEEKQLWLLTEYWFWA